MDALKNWIISHLHPRKTINKRMSSYGLKHVAERDIGYITNEQFIAAMLACGFRGERSGDSPNYCFNYAFIKE